MRKMGKKMALLLPLALCGTTLTGCLDSEELVQVLEDSLVQVLGGEAAGEGASGTEICLARTRAVNIPAAERWSISLLG